MKNKFRLQREILFYPRCEQWQTIIVVQRTIQRIQNRVASATRVPQRDYFFTTFFPRHVHTFRPRFPSQPQLIGGCRQRRSCEGTGNNQLSGASHQLLVTHASESTESGRTHSRVHQCITHTHTQPILARACARMRTPLCPCASLTKTLSFLPISENPRVRLHLDRKATKRLDAQILFIAILIFFSLFCLAFFVDLHRSMLLNTKIREVIIRTNPAAQRSFSKVYSFAGR